MHGRPRSRRRAAERPTVPRNDAVPVDIHLGAVRESLGSRSPQASKVGSRGVERGEAADAGHGESGKRGAGCSISRSRLTPFRHRLSCRPLPSRGVGGSIDLQMQGRLPHPPHRPSAHQVPPAEALCARTGRPEVNLVSNATMLALQERPWAVQFASTTSGSTST